MALSLASPLHTLLDDIERYFFRNADDEQVIPNDGSVSKNDICTKCDKSVRFAEQPRVYETLSLENLTAEERGDVWYDVSFLLATKQLIKDTTSLMADGKLNEDEGEFCSRGLEGKTRGGSRRRSKNKSNAISAVLDEQYRQFFESDPDPIILAGIYVKHTSECKKSALNIAQQDEEEASRYLSNSFADERETKVLSCSHSHSCASMKVMTNEEYKQEEKIERCEVSSPMSKVKACNCSINVTPRYVSI